MRRQPGHPLADARHRVLAVGLAGLALTACASVDPPAAGGPAGARDSVAIASAGDWGLQAANLAPRGTPALHMPLRPGFRHVLERNDDPEHTGRVEVRVLEGTEPFDVPGLGRFECAVVETEELRDGALARQVQEWMAVDTTTRAVYCFGAVSWDVDSLGDRVFAGMWRVGDGDDGPAPGPALVVPGRAVRGERHRAVERGSGADAYLEVMESGVEVDVPAGTFTDCVRIRQRDAGDPARFEDRWWCPGIGLVRGRSDGVLVASDALKSDLSSFGRHHRAGAATPSSARRITPEQAQAIALKEVPGTFRNIVIERRGPRLVYTVEIIARKDGVETDVFVDVATGAVVATER